VDLPTRELKEEQGAGWLPQPLVYAAMAPTDFSKNRGVWCFPVAITPSGGDQPWHWRSSVWD